MKLSLNSLAYHNCPVQLREKVTFDAEQRRYMLKQMHTEQAISEAVILQTCNRLEFYLYASKSFDCSKFLAGLIGLVQPAAVDTWTKYSAENVGTDVVRHLFEVAAGLDSQMIGENQILSQVKSAYREATDCRTSKLIFHRLFHSAFRVGKAVRTYTDINCGAVSIGLAAVELAKREMDLSAATAMVIGAGENAELVARYLLKLQVPRLIIANRNKRRAQVLLKRLGKGQVIGLADIVGKLPQADLVISSTGAVEPIVAYEAVKDCLAGRKKPLLVVDIAVPRDMEPKIGELDCVTLYSIDDLNERIISNSEKRQSEIPKARAIVQQFTSNFCKWYDSLNVVPVISRLMQKGTELARSEARRYAKDFGEGKSDKLESFAESLVKKLLHGPISFIKNGGNEEPSTEQLQALELINKMFFSEDEGN